MKLKIKYVPMAVFLTAIFSGGLFFCSRDGKTFINGYAEKNKLIENFAAAVFSNNQKKVTGLLVNRKEYSKLLHSNLPEGDVKHGGMKADDFWETLLVKRRDAVIDRYLKKSLNRDCKIEGIGKSSEIKRYGDVTLYRETAVTFSCNEKDGKRSIVDDKNLFGVIAEKNGKFKVLNSFGD